MRVPYERKRKIAGLLFVLPWIIGALVFFAQPLVSTIRYSFSSVDPEMGITALSGGPLKHYIDAFRSDAQFMWTFTEELKAMLYSVPLIIVFSMFIANILVKKFAGRTFMRAMFFLPVIITSGVIIVLIQSSLTSVALGDETGGGNIFDPRQLSDLLLNSGLPRGPVEFISGMVGSIIDLVWKSGVQILIFVAGILAIPPSYYDVAAVEGSTGWESFWKITFPLIIPHIMINLIFTMVDIFSGFDNKVMVYIYDTVYTKIRYDFGSALAVIYFLVVMAFIGLFLLLMLLISRGLGKSDHERR